MNPALDLLFLFALTLVATGLGLFVLGCLRVSPAEAEDELALSLALGLGSIGLLVVTFGMLQVLRGWVPGVGALLVAAAALCGYRMGWRRWRRDGGGALAGAGGRAERGAGWLPWTVLGIVAAATLACSLVPVTDGDALCYHLLVPRIFLERGGFVFEPDLHETIYPLLAESLFLVGLAVRGPEACRLVSWLTGIMLALCVMRLARRWMGRSAPWAGALAMASPVVSNGMCAPLNDVAIAAWCNAALLAVVIWLERPARGIALVAGLLAGLALGVKYPALVWAAVLAVLMAGWIARERYNRPTAGAGHRPAWSHLLLFVAGCAVFGAVWYGRAWFATGNPVFPFYKSVFGGSGLDVVLEPAKRPLAVTPWNLATALFPMTIDPDRFDSVSHQFGPLFLMLLPALFLMKAPRRLWVLVGCGFAYYLLCMTQRQSMRFLLAAVGPWAVGAGWVVWRLGQQPGKLARLGVLLVAGCLAAESALAVARTRHGASVLLGRESREAFLARREPTYRVGLWVAANLPRSARLIGQDHRGFYLPRPYTMELAHRRRTGLAAGSESAESVIARLGARGFTHLLMCPPVPEDGVEFDPTLSRVLEPWLARRRPIYEELLPDADGIRRAYAIYEIGPVPAWLAGAGPVGEGARR